MDDGDIDHQALYRARQPLCWTAFTNVLDAGSRVAMRRYPPVKRTKSNIGRGSVQLIYNCTRMIPFMRTMRRPGR